MSTSEPEPTPDLMREQRLQRNLKIVVGTLGVLILLGLGAIFARMALFASGPRGPSSAERSFAAPSSGTLAIEIPKGHHIVSVSLSGNRLAVHHDGPGGSGIAIVDIDTGARILDVRPTEAVPRN